ncbi:MAG: CinA family nicotinamide mononucleotide deamidase-related protein [Candidatus Omnitrophica bacterium]|nr:CinA family nicotinamide mononucleotide deamidase-related protein [Candidatus Omnitrophota bacterium]
MLTCELVTIGSELLNGSTLNTNAQFLAKRVTALDMDVVYQVSCRDKEREILDTLSRAFSRADLIIVTGGLGPTPDDLTRETVAKFFGCGLKFDALQYRHIVRYFKSLGRAAPSMTRREAFLPEAAKPLLNRYGIALGFYVFRAGKLLIVLPGVPRELSKMYDSHVHRLIQKMFKDRPRSFWIEAEIAGLYETQVMRKLGAGFFKDRKFDFGIYPKVGEVGIRIKTQDAGLASSLRRELVKKLGHYLYSFEGKSFSSVIGDQFIRQNKSLSIAESCTGGLLAEKITDSPGASRYFKGGLVAYSNQIKTRELGIRAALIARYGAVSKEAARAMAQAIRSRYQTSIGIGLTGIAGPSGGTKTKPVGLVYVAISDAKMTKVFKLRMSGDRAKIRLQATKKTLFLLWEWLIK